MHVAQVLLVFMKPMAKSVVSTLVSPASLTIVTCICTPQARLRSLQSRLSLIVITSFNSGIEAVRKLSTLWQHLVMHDYRVPAQYNDPVVHPAICRGSLVLAALVALHWKLL